MGFFRSYNLFRDTLDILVVFLVIYGLIKLIRDSRAEQLIKGIVLVGVFYGVAHLLGLTAVTYLLNILIDNALILLVVIFQPELRRMLESVGHSRLNKLSIFGMSEEDAERVTRKWQKSISAVCAAVEQLQRQRMGALIVFERSTKLGEIINSGTVVDADPTPELVANVFFNKAPLHDGAMIIREGRVYAAACILPLSDNLQINRELGTRHRAGVGMSENSDAVVVILSEETGMISMAVGGELKSHFSSEALRVALENNILWDWMRQDAEGTGKSTSGFFRRWRSK